MGDSGMTVNDSIIDRLQAAAFDGRGYNIRYRQNQLHLLHRYLREQADAFCSAISRDEDVTPEEAELEFYLSISTINQIYEQLNFEEGLVQEYAVSRLKNNIDRRTPYGIVVIRPGTFNRLFSIISPLATALGAGNCVLVEMPSTIRNVDRLVRDCLQVLDHDMYSASSNPIGDKHFLSLCLIIDQANTEANLSTKSLVSNAQAPVIAVVDRTARIEEAAKSIVTARCAFGGRSPHAPDIVLVNEFVKKDFIKFCLQQLTTINAKLASQNAPSSPKGKSHVAKNATVIYDSPEVSLLEITDRQTLPPKKIDSRTVVFTSVTGLVDAVTIASKINNMAACYCFADPKDAKFLSQHVDSRLTFVNQIPAHLLVGPAFPNSVGRLNPDLRYDLDMLSLPRPEQIALDTPVLAEASNYLLNDSPNASQLRQKALKPLKPTGQSSGTSMGFFDQGIITGIVAFVLPSVAILGFSVYKLGRFGMDYYYSS